MPVQNSKVTALQQGVSNDQSSAMTRLNALLFLPLLVIAGCTNVAGDAVRTIYPAAESALDSDTLFAVARNFFTDAGYQCDSEREFPALHCSKALRDLYVHQTHSVVQIFRDEGDSRTHTLVTTRWDEGLIPGEFISSEFTNPDVKAFCEHLKAQALGACQLLDFPA